MLLLLPLEAMGALEATPMPSFTPLSSTTEPTTTTSLLYNLPWLERFESLLFYEPPVGLVIVLAGWRLLSSGRLIRLSPPPTPPHQQEQEQQEQPDDQFSADAERRHGLSSSSSEAVVAGTPPPPQSTRTPRQRWRKAGNQQNFPSRRKMGRAVQLDRTDYDFVRYGDSVNRIRQYLCQTAFQKTYDRVDPFIVDDSFPEPLIEACRNAMDILSTCPTVRTGLLYLMIPSVAEIESFLSPGTYDLPIKTSTYIGMPPVVSSMRRMKPPLINDIDTHQRRELERKHRVVCIAIASVQIAILDGLLRVARDRILKTAHRLADEVIFWDRRILVVTGGHYYQHQYGWWHRLWLPFRYRRYSEENIMDRLVMARAAYHGELHRLGKVLRILTQSPPDMNESFLLVARKASVRNMLSYPKTSQNEVFTRKGGRHWTQRRKLLSTCAMDALLDAHQDENWLPSAHQWIGRARTVLYETVTDTLEYCRGAQLYASSVPYHTSGPRVSATNATREFHHVGQIWRDQLYSDNATIQQQAWITVLQFVDTLSIWRRVGEGRQVRLHDIIRKWWSWSRNELDFLGIPSYLLQVGMAYLARQLVLPHWPQIQGRIAEIVRITKEIAYARVWVPVKGIYDDVMNRNEGMMAGFSLGDEECTLDNMLRDIGFGDGTPEARMDALRDAAQEYERDLQGSAMFLNFASGRLVRLLLVQVQQLKVGMLQALDYIDVLMKGNRIHFQILAAIPAVWMVSYGTRLSLRALYNIRAKDLRPVTAIHAEMALYLEQIEVILLQGDDILTDVQLGEVHLLVHRYLLWLDYSAPLLSIRQCDAIHTALQNLLSAVLHGPRSWIALELLSRVQRKHKELVKHI